MLTKLLIVDDDEKVIDSLRRILRKEGYAFFSATSGQDALALLTREEIEVALVDYKMPGMDGFELLKRMKKKYPHIDVIMITGYGTVHSAVDAMKVGAYDYITKPLDPIELRKTLKTLTERKELISENKRLQAELESKYSFEGIIGNAPVMRTIFRTLIKASQSDSHILIQGESGTGKELVARSIHFNSPRAKKPFVPIDCGSISTQVIESELFGHVKGAFTGAYTAKKGLLKEADGGTAFLDEITEIPLETQAKFLRVLQEKEIRPVGIYYRLNVVPIFIPPLRERKEDIPFFVRYFMNEFREQEGKFESISRDAVQILMNHHWPGNVRELRNVIERIFVLGSGPVIDVNHLPLELVQAVSTSTEASSQGRTLSESEKDAILSALDKAEGNRVKAAKILGMGKSSLYRKLKQYNIT